VHARLDTTPDAARIRGRVAAGWRPDLGPVPPVVGVSDEKPVPGLRAQFADRPYDDERPRVRLARSPNSLLLAAHHSALDGLGLLALLGIILDAPVRSGAKGLAQPPPERSTGVFVRRAASRLGEAAFSPPARIAPDRRGSDPGDHLLEASVPGLTGGTATLLSAAALATDDWNAVRSPTAGRVVIAVGLSQRAGSDPTLADESAYARVVIAGRDPIAARLALDSAHPEPPPPSGSRTVALAARLGRPLSGRLGSTLLVSNLGRIEAPEGVQAIGFWPVAHGRSGVSLGVASVGNATMLGLRARRASFTDAGASELLDAIRRHLHGLEPPKRDLPS